MADLSGLFTSLRWADLHPPLPGHPAHQFSSVTMDDGRSPDLCVTEQQPAFPGDKPSGPTARALVSALFTYSCGGSHGIAPCSLFIPASGNHRARPYCPRAPCQSRARLTQVSCNARVSQMTRASFQLGLVGLVAIWGSEWDGDPFSTCPASASRTVPAWSFNSR